MEEMNISEVKKFLRVEHDEDDDVIEMLFSSSIGMVETRIKRPLLGELSTGAVATSWVTLPTQLKWAVMGIVAFLYENRETATDDDVRQRLLRNIALDRYIKYGGRR